MTMANLNVLDNTSISYDDFIDALAQWSNQWVSEIRLEIAENAEELYKNNAVIALVIEWKRAKEASDRFSIGEFKHVADHRGENLKTANIFHETERELSSAIYFLLVREWRF